MVAGEAMSPKDSKSPTLLSFLSASKMTMAFKILISVPSATLARAQAR